MDVVIEVYKFDVIELLTHQTYLLRIFLVGSVDDIKLIAVMRTESLKQGFYQTRCVVRNGDDWDI